eukprot:4313494-Ditylum_brightwellii.AAC.1
MTRCAVIARDTRHAPDQMTPAPALAGGWERTAHLVLASAYAVTRYGYQIQGRARRGQESNPSFAASTPPRPRATAQPSAPSSWM